MYCVRLRLVIALTSLLFLLPLFSFVRESLWIKVSAKWLNVNVNNQLKPAYNQQSTNQIKSLLLSHHHSTSALVSEILTSVLRQCKKTKQFTMDSHIYRLYRRQCAKYTYTYTQYTQCTIKTYLVTNTLYTPYVHVCIMYTSIHSNMWRCNRLYIYSRLVVQQIVVQRCNRLCICNVVDVLCMVSSDSRCVSAVCACGLVELC